MAQMVPITPLVFADANDVRSVEITFDCVNVYLASRPGDPVRAWPPERCGGYAATEKLGSDIVRVINAARSD